MIRHLTLLLTAALLVFSLTACGCSGKDSSTADSAVTDTQTGTAQDNTSPNTGTSNGESGAGTGTADTGSGLNGGSGSGDNSSAADNGQNTVGGAVDDAVDGVRDAVKSGARNAEDLLNGVSRRTGGTGFRQMVRNGRVHDTDGDLTDGENSRSDGNLF